MEPGTWPATPKIWESMLKEFVILKYEEMRSKMYGITITSQLLGPTWEDSRMGSSSSCMQRGKLSIDNINREKLSKTARCYRKNPKWVYHWRLEILNTIWTKGETQLLVQIYCGITSSNFVEHYVTHSLGEL